MALRRSVRRAGLRNDTCGLMAARASLDRMQPKPKPTVARSMLTPEELSARIGVPVGTLANWRTMRNNGIDIGPKFVKPSGEAGLKGRGIVRYLIRHIEEWEASLVGDECSKELKADPQDSDEAIAARPPLRMLTPAELSERSGIRLAYLSNWRSRRGFGDEIGPKFIKLGGRVRYLVSDVEEWERTHAARDKMFPASTAPRREWD
jgi:hypothetical protein